MLSPIRELLAHAFSFLTPSYWRFNEADLLSLERGKSTRGLEYIHHVN